MPPCATCSTPFDFSLQELALHEKITSTFETGPVPLSRHCAECRLRRKMVWRNERHLHQRTCDSTGKTILSVYPTGTSFPVYARHAWWSDAWDAADFAQPFDFSRPFFEQFAELLRVVPRSALNTVNVENCDYCNFVFDSRNCYLSFNNYRTEGLLYCYWMLDCKDCMDCSYCFESQRCTDCADSNHCYNCHACALSNNCNDSMFLYDCRGCADCIGCVGLRRKSHCIFNEQLTPQEYKRRAAELDLQDPTVILLLQQGVNRLKATHPHRHSVQEKTENCTGDYVFESKDCANCYQMYRSQDCINVQDSETKDALDCYHPGWSELTYEAYSPVRQRASAFSMQCWTGNDVFYCDNCQSSSHCFGCVGLRNKQYCILNTQYSKEEYLSLLPTIIEHMKKTKEWGEFFPVALSPFPYNETMAHQDFPLSAEEVRKKGWQWSGDRLFTSGKETVKWDAVPLKSKDVPDSIMTEVLASTACSRNYKIIAQELALYREKQLPVPRRCPECRHRERLSLRNPRKLWNRECMKCKTTIETTYAPERSEIVYCEKCYLEAVY